MRTQTWPDGTPKSLGNVFTTVYDRPSVMANDDSIVRSANARSKRGRTETSPTLFKISPTKPRKKK